MGGGAEDYMNRKQHNQNNQIKFKLKVLVLIILTNLLTIYIFTNPYIKLLPISKYTADPPEHHIALVHRLNATQDELVVSRSKIVDLQRKLESTNLLGEKLLTQLTLINEATNKKTSEPMSFAYDDLFADMSNEAKLAIGPQKLPLGYSPRVGSDEIYPPIGGGCLRYKEELAQYLSYDVGGECPMDGKFAQKLLLKGCEPLPRRRCHPKSPINYVEPTPLPDSLWSTPPDTSIVWDPYNCKSYKCLIERRKTKAYYDCKDCFDLQYREKSRWLIDNGGLDFGINEVLRTRSPGTIRIGLDIGGGVGTFAARMKERNVTIITTTMNLDGPFNSFIASRGLVPIHSSISQRLPFFENTLDIVHSMHVLSNWIPDITLEFTLYDIYRVLRPGGLFWLDRFFCFESQLNATYVPMLNRVGFKELRWHADIKLDKGADKNEWYFSALLEKPMT